MDSNQSLETLQVRDDTPSVSAYFDRAAEYYDDVTSTHEGWAIPSVLSGILAELGPPSTSAIVVGCGTGHDIDRLLRHGVTGITAVDVSPAMIEVCRSKFPDVNYRVLDIQVDRLPKQTYGLSVCLGVLEFVQDPTRFLKGLRSLLAPGGTLVISYELHIVGYEAQDQVKEVLASKDGERHDGAGVTLFRYNAIAFQHMLVEARLAPVSHRHVFAYRDDYGRPTFYGLVLCTRAS